MRENERAANNYAALHETRVAGAFRAREALCEITRTTKTTPHYETADRCTATARGSEVLTLTAAQSPLSLAHSSATPAPVVPHVATTS